jgi:hypothetical protein
MADQTKKARLQAPGGSWESLKKIIRAYHAVADNESPTVEDVAKVAGLQRPVVSGNNNFLRSAGILQENANKLTPVGDRLATGLGINNPSLVDSAIREIVRSQEGLAYLVNLLKARSTMPVEAFRGEIVMIIGLDPDSRNLQFLKAILDMLQEGRIVNVENDEIHYKGTYVGDMSGRADTIPKRDPLKVDGISKSPSIPGSHTVPISLGVGRLVTIELPDDWTPSRDLPKLLKMLELALSDQEAPGEPR